MYGMLNCIFFLFRMLMPIHGTVDFWNKKCWRNNEALLNAWEEQERERKVCALSPTNLTSTFKDTSEMFCFCNQWERAKREKQLHVFSVQTLDRIAQLTRIGEKNGVCQPRATGIEWTHKCSICIYPSAF